MANDCIEADFSCEKELKQLVEKLGQLSMGEYVYILTQYRPADRQNDGETYRWTNRHTNGIADRHRITHTTTALPLLEGYLALFSHNTF